jgi:hypothetical protein
MEVICSSETWGFSELHGVTNDKTVFFILIAVRNSNPKCRTISSHILSSHFAPMVETASKSEKLATPPHPAIK